MELLSKKCNFADFEMILRQIKTMHNHLQQVTSCFVEQLRYELEATHKDNEQITKNKKVNLLNNAFVLYNQIKNFDSSSVNDCFDNKIKEFVPVIDKNKIKFKEKKIA